MKFLAIDFETSGTDPQQNAPVSLGVAACEDMGGTLQVHDKKEWLIKPPTHYKTGAITRCYDERAAAIHGYSMQYLIENGTDVGVVCQGLADFIVRNGLKGRPSAAYNMPFDASFLSTLMFLAGDFDRHSQAFRPFTNPISGTWFDVMSMAQRLTIPDKKLDTVATHLGLSRSTDMHGALEDAILCAECLVRLRPRGKE